MYVQYLKRLDGPQELDKKTFSNYLPVVMFAFNDDLRCSFL